MSNDLLNKIRKIEALIEGAKSTGERQAAENAKKRIQQKMNSETPREFSIACSNHWHKKLFVTLCSKHQIKTYRYFKQKHTTAMIRIPKSYLDEILWPEFQQYSKIFEELANDILLDLTNKIHNVPNEEELVIAGELSG